MKIIDVDLWAGGYDALRRRATEEKLIRDLDAFGITQGIVRTEAAKFDPKTGNSATKSLCASHPGRLGACAVLDPVLGEENVEGEGSLTERLRAFSPSALAVFPDEKRVVFSSFYWEEVLSAANSLSMPLFVFQNYDSEFFRHLPETAGEYPDVKFVISGYGCTGSRNIFPLIAKTSNVYFAVSKMLDYMQIEEICSRGGCSRLLFGSQYPDFTPAGALGLIAYADIPDKQKQMIFSENWEAIRP